MTAMAVVAVETPHLMVRLAAPVAGAVALLMVKMRLALVVVHQRQQVDLVTMEERATQPRMVVVKTLEVLAGAVVLIVLVQMDCQTLEAQMAAAQRQLS